jgi:hypothetical protein
MNFPTGVARVRASARLIIPPFTQTSMLCCRILESSAQEVICVYHVLISRRHSAFSVAWFVGFTNENHITEVSSTLDAIALVGLFLNPDANFSPIVMVVVMVMVMMMVMTVCCWWLHYGNAAMVMVVVAAQ